MNLPNKLTVSRIGMTFVIVALLTIPGLPWAYTAAVIVFAIAGFTDIADGTIARRRGLITPFGQLMDPLADKILISASFISFVAIGHLIPAWIVIAIISREFLITGLRLLAIQKGLVLPASSWGKHKLIWQTIAIVTILVGLSLQVDILPRILQDWSGGATLRSIVAQFFLVVDDVLVWIVAALTFISGGVYMWQCRDLYCDRW
ncbi:MAG: CDP-diacylglycerol--glycerol-3-phosphate 3-phosphatidyltransferase [bacterium]